jgi:hypothetical protein
MSVISGILEGLNIVKTGLDKWIPDAKDRLEAELLVTKQMHELALAQVELNKVEAANTNVFISGWRPMVGWVCAASFFYAVIGNDLLNYVLQLVSMFTAKPMPVFPEPDTTITMELLFAMLGVGAMRSWDKKHAKR